MTTKRYQQIKLVIVVLLAIFFSQTITHSNFILSMAVLIAASLVLMYLRKLVKGVIADERDYATGGKAALLAMQIYSWIAVVAMFGLYALKDINPYYQPIGTTLAFSTCILMLIYSVIFRYHNKVKWTDKRLIYTAAVLVIFLMLAVVALRLFSGEDNWICQNGQWVKHGQPDFSAPAIECK